MHAVLDHGGMLPSFVTITDARMHETRVANEAALPLIPDSILSVDRGYTDYKWLYSLELVIPRGLATGKPCSMYMWKAQFIRGITVRGRYTIT